MTPTLEQLKLSSQITEETTWPGTDIPVSIRVPNDQDMHEAGIATDRIFKSAEIKIGMENIREYEAEKNTQLLFRCVCDKETKKPLTKNIEEFRRLLTGGVRETLLNDLSSLQERISPEVDRMTEEQFSELFAAVKKNAEKIISSVSNISLLRRLIITLANQHQNAPAENGSS